MTDYHAVAALDDIAEGSNRAFKVGDLSVLICRQAGEVFAIENNCTHALQALEGGKMRGDKLFCPAHGACFNLRTGQPIGTVTRKPVRTFPVRVTDGTIEVSLGD
ncbi:Rieske (2Fe-2S) protein [Parapedomonas caeni]